MSRPLNISIITEAKKDHPELSQWLRLRWQPITDAIVGTLLELGEPVDQGRPLVKILGSGAYGLVMSIGGGPSLRRWVAKLTSDDLEGALVQTLLTDPELTLHPGCPIFLASWLVAPGVYLLLREEVDQSNMGQDSLDVLDEIEFAGEVLDGWNPPGKTIYPEEKLPLWYDSLSCGLDQPELINLVSFAGLMWTRHGAIISDLHSGNIGRRRHCFDDIFPELALTHAAGGLLVHDIGGGAITREMKASFAASLARRNPTFAALYSNPERGPQLPGATDTVTVDFRARLTEWLSDWFTGRLELYWPAMNEAVYQSLRSIGEQPDRLPVGQELVGMGGWGAVFPVRGAPRWVVKVTADPYEGLVLAAVLADPELRSHPGLPYHLGLWELPASSAELAVMEDRWPGWSRDEQGRPFKPMYAILREDVRPAPDLRYEESLHIAWMKRAALHVGLHPDDFLRTVRDAGQQQPDLAELADVIDQLWRRCRAVMSDLKSSNLGQRIHDLSDVIPELKGSHEIGELVIHDLGGGIIEPDIKAARTAELAARNPSALPVRRIV